MQARYLSRFAATQRGMPVVRIDGKWREILDIWDDEGDAPEAVALVFGADSEHTALAKQCLGWSSPCWVMVRYLVEERSDGSSLEDATTRWRTCELIDVQVAVD